MKWPQRNKFASEIKKKSAYQIRFISACSHFRTDLSSASLIRSQLFGHLCFLVYNEFFVFYDTILLLLLSWFRY